jgi:hypothetical protein
VRKPDIPALVSGLAVIGLGVALLLDATGEADLTFGTLAPVVCAAVGATLLALGLSRRS